MKFNMERRQKYFEDLLRKQQRQISMISKELELHREFLNLQFESFMDFLFQNGGQIIKNGKDQGMFFPMKKEMNGGSKRDREDSQEGDDEGEVKRMNGNHDERNVNRGDSEEKHTPGRDQGENGEEGEEADPLPPPQAILGSPSGAECSDDNQEASGSGSNNVNGHYQRQQNGSRNHQDEANGNSSRRSSQNVVSSTDAQNGNGEEYEDDGESGGEEFENTSTDLVGQHEMLKYVQNFMFSHFLDGGAENNNGMDDSYNDNDDDMGGYEGEEDEMDHVDSSRPFNGNASGQHQHWSNNPSSSMRNAVAAANLQHLAAKQVSGGNSHNLPIPASNIPHNERTCRYCGKTFHWKQSWVIHERTHTGEKPYLCKCGKAFSQKSNMNTHAKSCAQAMTTQKGKTTVFQMKCSHCQKMFTHKKNLDLHMEKFHPEVLNLSVKPSTSSSSSPTSSSLHQHYQNGLEAEAAAARVAAENAAILNILKSAVSSSVAASSSGKGMLVSQPPLSPTSGNESLSGGEDKNGRYPCPYCPKRFPVKGTLERHLRVHTGEKPFLCGICGKAFTQKGSVKLHLERVHRQTM